MPSGKSSSLSGGSGVHVWLVLWKSAQAVEAYALFQQVIGILPGPGIAIPFGSLHSQRHLYDIATMKRWQGCTLSHHDGSDAAVGRHHARGVRCYLFDRVDG